jgi:hypothetical protein
MKFLQLSDAEGMMLKILAGCLCFFLLVMTACVCMVIQRKVDAGFLWPIIAMICGFAGISSFDFKQFRTTDYGYQERKGEADAKVAAATKAAPPTPVVQSPAAAVEIHS